jgi:recombinational DNA repair protein (RecF pathway)
MGQLQRRRDEDQVVQGLGGGLHLESCRVCGTPLTIIGEVPEAGPICQSCAAAAQAEASGAGEPTS